MMATTHMYAALALVSPVVVVAPEFAIPVAIGAILGGVLPDLDVFFSHRRTLHFPVYGGVVAIPAIVVAAIVPTSISIGLAVLVFAAWVHALSEPFGGGPELAPWEESTDHAVYDHWSNRWIGARKVVRYDGSPEDFAIGLALAVPPLMVFDGIVGIVIVATMIPALGYTLFRRRLVNYAPDWLE